MSKRGVTVVEIVVAMAIAVIVSVFAYSTCSFAIAQSQRIKTKNFFISQSQNFVNCYFLGSEKYSDGIKFLTDCDVNYGEDATIYYSNDYKITTQDKSQYYINLIFDVDSFSVECHSNSSSNLIFDVRVWYAGQKEKKQRFCNSNSGCDDGNYYCIFNIACNACCWCKFVGEISDSKTLFLTGKLMKLVILSVILLKMKKMPIKKLLLSKKIIQMIYIIC